MGKAKTRTGLSVVVDILDKVYETGRQVSQATKDAVNLVRDTRPAPMELSYLTQFVISGSYFVSVPRPTAAGRAGGPAAIRGAGAIPGRPGCRGAEWR